MVAADAVMEVVSCEKASESRYCVTRQKGEENLAIGCICVISPERAKTIIAKDLD